MSILRHVASWLSPASTPSDHLEQLESHEESQQCSVEVADGNLHRLSRPHSPRSSSDTDQKVPEVSTRQLAVQRLGC